VEYLYAEDAPLRDKVYAIAHNVYGASVVEWSTAADRRLKAFEEQGLGGLPICMAKTPYSLTHDPAIRNRPTQFVFEINDVRASTGAGFVYPLAGDVVTMPGLPRSPRALDVDKDGNVTGLNA